MSEETGDSDTRMQNSVNHIQQFDSLFHEHKKAVFRYACYLTQNRDEAEDLFQETWLRVAKHFSKIHDVQNFKSWVFTITANLFRDALRKKKVQRLLMTHQIKKEQNDSQIKEQVLQNPFRFSDQVDVIMALNQAMMHLPLRQKQIFILKEIEGFKLIEISTMLKLPMGTVKSLLHRAVKRLRQSLKDFRDEAK